MLPVFPMSLYSCHAKGFPAFSRNKFTAQSTVSLELDIDQSYLHASYHDSGPRQTDSPLDVPTDRNAHRRNAWAQSVRMLFVLMIPNALSNCSGDVKQWFHLADESPFVPRDLISVKLLQRVD